jgi:hypothetical protein
METIQNRVPGITSSPAVCWKQSLLQRSRDLPAPGFEWSPSSFATFTSG